MTDFFDRMRPFIKERNLCNVGHEECWIDIVDAAFEPRVPNFVGLIDLDKREFFISSDVPRGFRRPIIAHELRCFTEKAEGHAGHCVAAVDFELKFVLPEDREKYLVLRRKFFSDLIAYATGGDDNFLRELGASSEYLQLLQ